MKNLVSLFIILIAALSLQAQELVYQDHSGTIRWKSNKKEIALFGANYCLPSACDFRAASYVGGDLKQMIVEDMQHFKRMSWEGLRLCFWGDSENSDINGNLINNVHLDLLDYLIAEATKQHIYMLFSPIVTYSSQFPESFDDSGLKGFARHYQKAELYNNEQAVKAQENYLRQLLCHRNPYTGRCLKDEPNILFIELINEPAQHTEDIPGTVRYINRLHDAVRSVGCKKITFYNVSQDYDIAPAIRQSKVQGSTHAWYPTALNSGHTRQGNILLLTDRYEQMLNPNLNGKAKLVYEFDTPDVEAGYVIPAMVREYRRGGIQFATHFSYDMQQTASRNLGWQTHYMNMVNTPSKAISGIIAAEVMRRIPRGTHYGYYPDNNKFGDFRVSYEEKLSELNSNDMFYYSNNTTTSPKDKQRLSHIVGCGSSPVIKYDGTGIYFLDKDSRGEWTLEIYPDIMNLEDPFNAPNKDKIVRAAVSRKRTMELHLPDIDTCLQVTPGKYIIGRKHISKSNEKLLFKEDTISDWKVVNHTQPETARKNNFVFKCDVFGPQEPKDVILYLLSSSRWGATKIQMHHCGGFTYQAEINTKDKDLGLLFYHIGIETQNESLLFPANTKSVPGKWDYYNQEKYSLLLTNDSTSLSLLNPIQDIDKIRMTRTNHFSPKGKVTLSTIGEELNPAILLETPSLEHKADYKYPCDISISFYIGNKLDFRPISQITPKALRIKAKGMNKTHEAICCLIDKNGYAYGAPIHLNTEGLSDIEIPVSKLVPVKAAMLPQDWPAVNSYWYPNSTKKNNPSIDWSSIEFIQFSLRDELYQKNDLTDKGIYIEKADLIF